MFNLLAATITAAKTKTIAVTGYKTIMAKKLKYFTNLFTPQIYSKSFKISILLLTITKTNNNLQTTLQNS